MVKGAFVVFPGVGVEKYPDVCLAAIEEQPKVIAESPRYPRNACQDFETPYNQLTKRTTTSKHRRAYSVDQDATSEQGQLLIYGTSLSVHTKSADSTFAQDRIADSRLKPASEQ